MKEALGKKGPLLCFIHKIIYLKISKITLLTGGLEEHMDLSTR